MERCGGPRPVAAWGGASTIPGGVVGGGETGGVTDVHEATSDAPRAVVERWFIHRGLPHLITGYNVREDVFTRAAPLLAFVFVAEILLGGNADYVWWANLLAVLGAAAIALGGLAAVNRFRGRRLLQRPDAIGVPELVVFIIVPPLLPLVFGGQVLQSVEIFVANLVVLAVASIGTSFGVVPMLRWAFGQMASQLGTLGNLIFRSLPLLLLFSMFLFFNAELWKIMDDLPALLWWSAVALLVAVGSAFVAIRIPRELDEVATFGSWSEVRATCRSTAVAPVLLRPSEEADPSDVLVADDADLDVPPPPAALLDRRGRANVSLVFFAAQATQIALVTVVIGAFYVLFGLLTIIPSTIEQWTGSAQLQRIASATVFGTEVVLTVELLRTATFIACVSGLQFTVAALTDATYRAEFLADTVAEVRQAFAVRALYLARLVPAV